MINYNLKQNKQTPPQPTNMRTIATIALFAVASAINTLEAGAGQQEARVERDDDWLEPTRREVERLTESCEWLGQNVDWDKVKEINESDYEEINVTEDIFQEIWRQAQDSDAVRNNEISESEARDICTACAEIHRVQQDFEDHEHAGDWSPADFFDACAWLGHRVSDEAYENEDFDRAWEDIKEEAEVDGWTREQAQPVMFNCLVLGKKIEEDEGPDFRPAPPGSCHEGEADRVQGEERRERQPEGTQPTEPRRAPEESDE